MEAYSGWEMPAVYSTVESEHEAVRKRAGVFDLSHMGEIFVRGKKAGAWLDSVLTNHVSELEPHEAQYTFLLNEAGGVIDDVVLCHLAEDGYLLLVNPGQQDEIVNWLEKHLGEGVEVTKEGSEWAGMAVQGPDAPDVYMRMTGGRCLPSKNHLDDMQHGGARVLVSRTGYSGEDGFELFCPAAYAEKWFRLILDEGVTPCGLEARDLLRLEMGYPAKGKELDGQHTLLEARQGKFAALEKEISFIGMEVLQTQKEEGLKRRLTRLLLKEGESAQAGDVILDDEGREIGEVTSAALSPSLGRGIALAYLPVAQSRKGTLVEILSGGKKLAAKVTKKPFYRK